MQRLLVVEDDNSVRNTIQTFLELEGYTVDAVASTREALERLRDDAYPIVISDIYVDERTGLDVLHAAGLRSLGLGLIAVITFGAAVSAAWGVSALLIGRRYEAMVDRDLLAAAPAE